MCCQVNVTKGTLSQAEIDAYVDHARQKYNREPLSMDIAVDGGEVELPTISATCRSSGFAASRAIWWARSTASTTPSALRNMTA